MKMFSIDYMGEFGTMQNVILFADSKSQASSKVCSLFNPSAIFAVLEVVIKGNYV